MSTAESLESMGMGINYQEALAMTSIADTCRDGLITYSEFKDISKRVESASVKLLESDIMSSPASRTAKSFSTAVLTPFNWAKSTIALSKNPKTPFRGVFDEEEEQ